MNTDAKVQKQKNPSGENGMFGGALLGMVAGLMYAGPHFHEWSFIISMSIVFACCVAGGILGYSVMSVAFSASDTISPHYPGLGDLNDVNHDTRTSEHDSNAHVSEDSGHY